MRKSDLWDERGMWDWEAHERVKDPDPEPRKIKHIIYESEEESDEEVKIEHREILDDEEVVVVSKKGGGVVGESRTLPSELQSRVDGSVMTDDRMSPRKSYVGSRNEY
jgi:hypothetical protein